MPTSKISVVACLIPIAVLGALSAGAATLSGDVLHFDGSTIANAPVRAQNEALGIDARTRSGADGSYVLADLPDGTYLVTVFMDCCLFQPYINDAVEVAGRRSALDIHLVAFNIDVEGDDPRAVNVDLLSRQAIPDLPVPRMPDGKPDLSGVWLPTSDPYPESPPALDWAQAEFERRLATNFIDHPSAHCLPGSPPAPGGAAFIAGFVQRSEVLVMLLEEVAGFRQIFLDGREHPESVNPTWLGHSIGRWEGDTLIVDTVGFNDRGWVADYPRTTNLRIEERYRRISYGELEVTVTYDDPGVFSRPWSQHMVWPLAAEADVMEYVCENNQWIGTRAEDVGLAPR